MRNRNTLQARVAATRSVLWIPAFLAVASLLSGCGPTSTGNPLITIESQSYATASIFDLLDPIPSAYAAVSGLTLCFKQIRFDIDSSGPSRGGTGNVEFRPGEVTLDSAGTLIGQVRITAGIYKRVEFDFDNSCLSGNSVDLTNTNGHYTTQDTITMKFEGAFTADQDGDILNLGFQNIISALDAVNDPTQIKTTVEDLSVVGSF